MVPRGRPVALILVLFAAAFAGCLGDGDDPATGGDGTGTGSGGDTSGGDGSGGDGGSGGQGSGAGNTSNRAPLAVFTVELNGTTATFNASASSDPDGDTLNFAWDFGDNETDTGMIVNHTYEPGNYTVVLTVTDSAGRKANVAQNLTALAGGFDASETGTIATPNPLMVLLPYVLNSGSEGKLEHYQTSCVQAGMCMTYEYTDVPTTGTTLTFDLKGSGTGDLNLVVFDGDGEQLGASGATLNVNEKVTLSEADAQVGHYFAFVYMPFGQNLGYTLTVTLA